MKPVVLITGNTGYIGTVMTEFFCKEAYPVVGLDSDWFREKYIFPAPADEFVQKQIIKDIRDISEEDLEGVGAVIHLAALSNDPLGEINPELTDEINHKSTVKLALLCKKKGISRFIFASSCSMYGIASHNMPIDEEGTLSPITAYARAKVLSEQRLAELADKNFHPTFLRNATVYGLSPRLRLDLVVNNLAACAYLTGEIAIMSDGTPWRPIVHVEDLCKAFKVVLDAPIQKIHAQAFNIGTDEENYRIKDMAERIQRTLPASRVKILNKYGPDERTYKVNFSKFEKTFPEFKPLWNIEKGIAQLLGAFKRYGLTIADFESDKYFRIRTVRSLLNSGKMDKNLIMTGGQS